MKFDRLTRRIFNKKGPVKSFKKGVPLLRDLKNGQTVLRLTAEGLVEYTKANNALYKKVLDKG